MRSARIRWDESHTVARVNVIAERTERAEDAEITTRGNDAGGQGGEEREKAGVRQAVDGQGEGTGRTY